VDRAAILANENITHFPTEVEKQVIQLKGELDARLGTIQKAAEQTANGLILVSVDAIQKERLGAQRELFEQKVANTDLQIAAVRENQKTQQDGFKLLLDEMIKGRDVALAAALQGAAGAWEPAKYRE